MNWGFEIVLRAVEIDRPPVLGLHGEIVQPDVPPGALADDPVRGLADHAEAHILQHRQDVGQRQRLVRVVDPEMDPEIVEAGRAPEVGRDRAGAEDAVDLRDIGQRLAGAVAFAIARRESVLVKLENLQPFGLAMGLGKRLAERVAPVAAGLGEPVLDRLQIEIDRPARRGGDDELHSRMGLVGDLEVDHRDRGAELLLDDLPHDSPQLRGVAFARHVDQAGDEPVEGVAPGEQRDLLAAADLQDAEPGPQQVVVGILEQIAARQRFEDLQQRHPVMAVRREARARDHRRRLAGEHGDVREAFVDGPAG